MENKLIIKRPLITEKSTASAALGKYCFKIDKKATKSEIKKAIEKKFNVKVEKVNIMNYIGKERRRGRTQGRTASWKKAIVTLKKGDKIELFEGIQ